MSPPSPRDVSMRLMQVISQTVSSMGMLETLKSGLTIEIAYQMSEIHAMKFALPYIDALVQTGPDASCLYINYYMQWSFQGER